MFEKDALYQHAQKFFEETEVDVYPARNWLLVRVLPREMKVGAIFLPDTQNKVLLEGIVIRAFAPYWVFAKDARYHHKLRGMWNEREVDDAKPGMVRVISQVGPGDHILFPSHEGLPVGKRLDETKYRFVEECMVNCKLHYHPKGWLAGQLGKFFGVKAKKKIEKLLEEADVILKDAYQSKTRSGA